ncbi:E3 ubiquitin ligase [Tieghemiomyces parasiticus]|uniref:E3 ubiquitin ligase n=1 Tax=Tieghemiomyces parasiticus TaxID=78921 RepID=A0A9W8AED0_9FUNG|nr:E3 ubiquitin ligase [Tieghemiomyces parasiticus]
MRHKASAPATEVDLTDTPIHRRAMSLSSTETVALPTAASTPGDDKLASRVQRLCQQTGEHYLLMYRMHRVLEQAHDNQLARERTLETARQAATCAVCAELYTQPCTLECGHSFCRTCLRSWLPVNKVCPHCRAPVRRRPVESYGLRDLVETIRTLGRHSVPVGLDEASHSTARAMFASCCSEQTLASLLTDSRAATPTAGPTAGPEAIDTASVDRLLRFQARGQGPSLTDAREGGAQGAAGGENGNRNGGDGGDRDEEDWGGLFPTRISPSLLREGTVMVVCGLCSTIMDSVTCTHCQSSTAGASTRVLNGRGPRPDPAATVVPSDVNANPFPLPTLHESFAPSPPLLASPDIMSHQPGQLENYVRQSSEYLGMLMGTRIEEVDNLDILSAQPQLIADNLFLNWLEPTLPTGYSDIPYPGPRLTLNDDDDESESDHRSLRLHSPMPDLYTDDDAHSDMEYFGSDVDETETSDFLPTDRYRFDMTSAEAAEATPDQRHHHHRSDLHEELNLDQSISHLDLDAGVSILQEATEAPCPVHGRSSAASAAAASSDDLHRHRMEERDLSDRSHAEDEAGGATWQRSARVRPNSFSVRNLTDTNQRTMFRSFVDCRTTDEPVPAPSTTALRSPHGRPIAHPRGARRAPPSPLSPRSAITSSPSGLPPRPSVAGMLDRMNILESALGHIRHRERTHRASLTENLGVDEQRPPQSHRASDSAYDLTRHLQHLSLTRPSTRPRLPSIPTAAATNNSDPAVHSSALIRGMWEDAMGTLPSSAGSGSNRTHQRPLSFQGPTPSENNRNRSACDRRQLLSTRRHHL